jgi:hypothetical protein
MKRLMLQCGHYDLVDDDRMIVAIQPEMTA